MKADKPLKTVKLAALLCLLSLANIPRMTAEEPTEYKETMYIYVFFALPPGELQLVKNVHLLFENMTTGPPINTSIPALNDRFVELEFAMTPAGGKFFVSFNIFFEPDLGNETAISYAYEIIEEFLKTFHFEGLQLLWDNIGLREGKLWIHKSFGYIPYTTEQVSAFFMYAPATNGFSRFIGSIAEKGSYWLKRANTDFLWTLQVTKIISKVLPWDLHNYFYTLSVKELLNTSLPIVEHPLEFQRIVVRIQENDTEQLSRGLTTYTISVKSVQPEGYVMGSCEWPNSVEIRYEPLFPIDDILIEMELCSHTQPNLQEMLIKMAIVAVIVLALLLVVLLYIAIRKKREKDEEWFEKFSRRIKNTQDSPAIKT